ncbi:MAG TPA: hypothetical protein VM537_23155 [Anaerolineae bacterium]|nr:hypothetical protein [Anaerolineae bacterium]
MVDLRGESCVVDFNPFDTDSDGDVDGINFLGFDYLIRRVLRPDEDKRDDDWDGARDTRRLLARCRQEDRLPAD